MSKRAYQNSSDSDDLPRVPRQNNATRSQATEESYSNQDLETKRQKLDLTPTRRSERLQGRSRRARRRNRQESSLRPGQSSSISPVASGRLKEVSFDRRDIPTPPPTRTPRWDDPEFAGSLIMYGVRSYRPFRKNPLKKEEQRDEAEDIQQESQIEQTTQEESASNNVEDTIVLKPRTREQEGIPVLKMQPQDREQRTVVRAQPRDQEESIILKPQTQGQERRPVTRAQPQDQEEIIHAGQKRTYEGQAVQKPKDVAINQPSRPAIESSEATVSLLQSSSSQLSPRSRADFGKFEQQMQELRRLTSLSNCPPPSYLPSTSSVPYIPYLEIPLGSLQKDLHKPQDRAEGYNKPSLPTSGSFPNRGSFTQRNLEHSFQSSDRTSYGEVPRPVPSTAAPYEQYQPTRRTGSSYGSHLGSLHPELRGIPQEYSQSTNTELPRQPTLRSGPDVYQQDQGTTSLPNANPSAFGKAPSEGYAVYKSRPRTTCNQCHRQRIRCDKVRPVCGVCARKGKRCDWAEPF